ncbi:MAG: hypothetical protein ABSB23_03685 [Bryobacteraceae bacterium]|jgi:hypothetical protein
MRVLAAASLLLLAGTLAFAQKRHDVEILEAKARRVEEGRISLDGRVRVTSGKSVKGLSLTFDFLTSDGELLSSEKAAVDDDVIKRGDDSPFHVETENPPGSVRFKIRAFDGDGRQLRVGNDGPFVID